MSQQICCHEVSLLNIADKQQRNDTTLFTVMGMALVGRPLLIDSPLRRHHRAIALRKAPAATCDGEQNAHSFTCFALFSHDSTAF
jgi:hypothetical protein